VPPLAFVGGVSAAGKTTLLGQVPGRDRTWLAWSASKLIAHELGLAALPTDDVTDVMRYQEALVRSYQRRSRAASLPIVLDGHFALPTRTGWMAVPVSIFHALAPRILVLLRADPQEIQRRRARRDGEAPTTADIGLGVIAELRAARATAEALGVALHEWPTSPATATALAALIEELKP
jgi:adenylate kinase